MTWPIRHLTAEDLDAFHSASLSLDATRHLDECAECRALVEQDRALVKTLETLSVFEPGPDFGDRVLARVKRPAPLPVRIGLPRRIALAASILASLGASIGWSLANRDLLSSWIGSATASLARATWEAVATVAQNVSEQPLVSELARWGAASSAGRLVAAGSVLVIGYTLAMFALRRLLSLPVRPVAHAG